MLIKRHFVPLPAGPESRAGKVQEDYNKIKVIQYETTHFTGTRSRSEKAVLFGVQEAHQVWRARPICGHDGRSNTTRREESHITGGF